MNPECDICDESINSGENLLCGCFFDECPTTQVCQSQCCEGLCPIYGYTVCCYVGGEIRIHFYQCCTCR